MTNCLTCKKQIKITLFQIARGRGKYCSRKCKYVQWNVKGNNNPNWKGGRKMNSLGYILIHKPTHPFAGNKGYVREHRLIMEQHLGRYLEPTEVVDHINGIKDDNRIENLKLFNNQGEHIKEEGRRGTYKGLHLNDHRERDNFGRFI